MKRSGKCPKCESTNVIADAKARDQGHMGVVHDMSVSTYRDPDAILFKETRTCTLSAWVCAACGFVEFYADTPKLLRI